MDQAPRTKELFKNPLHPYTQALFSAALPAHPDIVREEIILSGEVPSPINPPSGCRFHPRCPRTREIAQKEGLGTVHPRCRDEEPVLEPHHPGQFAACHFPLDDGALAAK